MYLNPIGSLKINLAEFHNDEFDNLPLAHIKYMHWDKAYEELPDIVKPILGKMFDLMPEDKKMQWVVDYKVKDLKVGDCGVPLEGWHLDCVTNPHHQTKPETHLLFSTHFGTEFVKNPWCVGENDIHFKNVVDFYQDLDKSFISVKPNTITQYGRFNLHRAPIVTKDCRRMTLRLTQTEVIKQTRGY